jgi:multidrug efflux pump subunit AcrA (membrane-fusion protein)
VDVARIPKVNRKRKIAIAVGVVTLALSTVAVSRLKPAAPRVDRAPIIIDSVRMGPMLRAVHGTGTLQPERVRYVSAVTAGRVERVHFRAGASVAERAVLLELSNPDVQLQALEAQRALAAAEAELLNLRTNLEGGRLTQGAAVAATRAQQQQAAREASSAEALADRNLVSPHELARARENAQQLSARLDAEVSRLRLLTQAVDSQVALQRAQVERLRAIAQFQQERVRSMIVTAGVAGVVQDLDLQPGQWVISGQQLARLVEPGRLKAVIRIPETQARDVAIGQSATVDTRNGVVAGTVVRVDPASQGGTVSIDIAFDGALPRGARPDLSVEGTVELERLTNVLHVGRPAFGQPDASASLFLLRADGETAERVSVRMGRASVDAIEVVRGLHAGDRVIISDMSQWDNVSRLRVR